MCEDIARRTNFLPDRQRGKCCSQAVFRTEETPFEGTIWSRFGDISDQIRSLQTKMLDALPERERPDNASRERDDSTDTKKRLSLQIAC